MTSSCPKRKASISKALPFSSLALTLAFDETSRLPRRVGVASAHRAEQGFGFRIACDVPVRCASDVRYEQSDHDGYGSRA